ncbi:MAG: DUF3052 domain-containing protein [Actinobacteria bacterium]|nr:DUF3052 domain-containing protein [Actinomycetota bacterium]
MNHDSTGDNPLHKRLGLRPGIAGAVISPPDDDANPLLPLPEGVSSVAQVEDLGDQHGSLDYIHYFARSRAELARVFPQLRDLLAAGGSLWISWIKQSSARRGGGLPGDLNENLVRRMALTSGMVDVKVAALDQDWSALKLVMRRH